MLAGWRSLRSLRVGACGRAIHLFSTPRSPFPISRMVSVDVKHHVSNMSVTDYHQMKIVLGCTLLHCVASRKPLCLSAYWCLCWGRGKKKRERGRSEKRHFKFIFRFRTLFILLGSRSVCCMKRLAAGRNAAFSHLSSTRRLVHRMGTVSVSTEWCFRQENRDKQP